MPFLSGLQRGLSTSSGSSRDAPGWVVRSRRVGYQAAYATLASAKALASVATAGGDAPVADDDSVSGAPAVADEATAQLQGHRRPSIIGPLPPARHGPQLLRCEWAFVFPLARRAGHEAAWRARTGPEQIEFIDEVLAGVLLEQRPGMSLFPKERLDLKIFETWHDFRVAVLNALLELFAQLHFRCELFHSAAAAEEGPESGNLIVLLHLSEGVAREHAERLEHEMKLDPDVAQQMRLPPPFYPGEKPYPLGTASFESCLTAHYLDVHKRPLFGSVRVIGGQVQTGKLFGFMERVRLMSLATAEHVDVNCLVHHGVIAGHFPVHCSDELVTLRRTWKTWHQPLLDVEEYFGEQIFFYFAWLGHLSYMLMPFALVGTLLEVLGFTLRGSSWHLDVGMQMGRSALAVCWATAYRTSWRRQENILGMERSLTGDASGAKRVNPKFRGVWGCDPVTGLPKKMSSPRRTFLLRVASHGVTLVFIFISAGAVASIFYLRNVLEEARNENASLIVGTMNSVQIFVLNQIWGALAPTLVEIENYRHLDSRRDALIWKMFLFRALNSYGAFLWIAFGRSCGLRKQCAGGDCIAELRVQLLSVFASYTLLTIWTDVVFPWLVCKLQLRRESWQARLSKASGAKPQRHVSFVEQQAKMHDYDLIASIEDYMTVTLQCGLTLLFFSVLPAVSVLAFATNLLQVRADAWKLTHTYRRPFPEKADNIGAWNGVLSLLSRAAVVVNAAIIIFSSELWEHRSSAERFVMLVATERFASLVVPCAEYFIRAVPSRVKIARRRRTEVLQRLHMERIRCPRCSVAQRTSATPDDTEGHPQMKMGSDAEREPARQFDSRRLRVLSDYSLAPHFRLPHTRSRLECCASVRHAATALRHRCRRRAPAATAVVPEVSDEQDTPAAANAPSAPCGTAPPQMCQIPAEQRCDS